MRLSAAAHGGGDEACLGQGRDTGRDNTWGTSAAHQERSCSPHVVRGASSGSSSCDAGAACRNPVVHPRKQPGYAGQPATVGSARQQTCERHDGGQQIGGCGGCCVQKDAAGPLHGSAHPATQAEPVA